MSQKYATIDTNGFPSGFYDADIHGARLVSIPDPEYVTPEVEEGQEIPEIPRIIVSNPHTKIPTEAVEITDEQWFEFINNNGFRQFIDGAIVEYIPPVQPNAELLLQINSLEGTITARRLREAVLGTDNGWLANIEDEIEDLRAQLV